MQELKEYCASMSAAFRKGPIAPWHDTIMALTEERLFTHPHGDLKRWWAAVQKLPREGELILNENWLKIGAPDENPAVNERIYEGLWGLRPWRKGPFNFFGTEVDTEWRSDWKWERVVPHIAPLKNRRVLDVGCGSGYHCWRMYAEGARQVLGIDPTLLFMLQYYAVKRVQPELPVWFAPLRMEELPPQLEGFDTVFSMGVLYHRRSPLDHILELRDALKPGGQMVLETLVIEGAANEVLMPEDRYAAMRNVYFLPSVDMLCLWLRRCGFENARVVDENITTIEEQKCTPWMQYQSLEDFLDPHDHTKTREGYPSPRRAVILAEKPKK